MSGIRKEQLEPMSIPPIQARTVVVAPPNFTVGVVVGDYAVFVDASGAGQTVTVELLDATLVAGRTFIVMRTDNAGSLLVVKSAVLGQTISGQAQKTIVGSGSQVTVVSDGSNYWQI